MATDTTTAEGIALHTENGEITGLTLPSSDGYWGAWTPMSRTEAQTLHRLLGEHLARTNP